VARGQPGAAQEVKGREQTAPDILPPAAFVHPCTAELGGAIAKGAFERVDREAVAAAAEMGPENWTVR
jgi:hypothetical protein